ncbi:Peptidase M20 [Trypanosoma melophagium]|nr:Peptidase M20 [Trypanosoma melophagium]KAH9600972.1 Peptidase M20 [Trypanosoma melophagium]KAH9600988.1 Peptidase M20 [Trypanosoma melophagium]KAH9600990.1 Peptidase M20 [Trypanosoma melophagium]KAH9601017.1 Peptidase M20 [Trypanosoma melophagium]
MATQAMNHRQWLEKLIAFDTTSRNSNLDLIQYCREYLEGLGVKCTLLYNAEKTKANLWATLPGDGGVTDGGIILSGHTDVVPVDGQSWDTDPFTLTEKDGRLYGRGTSDMKGFIAVAMSLTPEFLRMRRARPIHFSWSYDEEVGCLGGKALAEYLRDNNIKADGCIIGEPTGMLVLKGNKGRCEYTVRVRGKAVHSSFALTDKGCNAIDYAMKFIAKVREMGEEFRRSGHRDNDFVVPFTTLSTNLIKGGNAGNTVPAECEFSFEFRNLPHDSASTIDSRLRSYVDNELLPAMRAEFADASIEISAVGPTPPFEGSEESAIVKLARTITGDKGVWKVAGCTEAGYFAGVAGVPTVVCGPYGDAVHCANEYVTVSQLEKCREFLLKVAESLKPSCAHL